jgi:hypothetical protein
LLLVVCPFVLFLLAIVSSVLLQLSASDYFVGIFKGCLVLVVFEQVSSQVVDRATRTPPKIGVNSDAPE